MKRIQHWRTIPGRINDFGHKYLGVISLGRPANTLDALTRIFAFLAMLAGLLILLDLETKGQNLLRWHFKDRPAPPVRQTNTIKLPTPKYPWYAVYLVGTNLQVIFHFSETNVQTNWLALRTTLN